MFDYASNNSSIYTKCFLNCSGGEREREKKESNPFELERKWQRNWFENSHHSGESLKTRQHWLVHSQAVSHIETSMSDTQPEKDKNSPPLMHIPHFCHPDTDWRAGKCVVNEEKGFEIHNLDFDSCTDHLPHQGVAAIIFYSPPQLLALHPKTMASHISVHQPSPWPLINLCQCCYGNYSGKLSLPLRLPWER